MNPRLKEFMSFVMAMIILISAVFTTPVSAQSGNVGDLLKLSSETIPDGTVLIPNQQFTKCWTVLNAGDTVWNTSYSLNFVSGEQMSAPTTTIKIASNVDRKNTIQICSNFVTPTAAGRYKSVWQMKNASGQLFDHQIYAEIVVQNQGNNVTYQSASSATPEPKNFDFIEVSSSEVQIYYNGQWIKATPGPYYTVKDDTASIKFYYYNACHTKYYVEDWSFKSKQECTKQYRSISDSGLEPAISISEEGTYQFYSYMRGLTGLNMVANVSAQGMVQGINGYQAIDIGPAASAKFQAITRSASRAGPLVMVVSFIVVAERVWVITYPISPVPVETAPSTGTTALLSLLQTWTYAGSMTPRIGATKGSEPLQDPASKGLVSVFAFSINGSCGGFINVMWFNPKGQKINIIEEIDPKGTKDNLPRACVDEDLLSMFVRWTVKAIGAGLPASLIRFVLFEGFALVVKGLGMEVEIGYFLNMFGKNLYW